MQAHSRVRAAAPHEGRITNSRLVQSIVVKRRQVLATAGLVPTGLAGCVAPLARNRPGKCAGEPRISAPVSASALPTGDDSIDLPVPMSNLSRGALRDEIPAITAPEFAADWSGVKPSLTADDLVIGIARNGHARAYPLATLTTYEVVNDVFGGPLLVTYCPLCASGLAAVREVDGEKTVFGVSGLLYHSNLVLYDRLTNSLWSQLLAKAIRGPQTGSDLTLVPSMLTTWGMWLETFPSSDVLLPPPTSKTISYFPESMPTGVHGHVGVIDGAIPFDDDRLPRKALVVGVVTAQTAKAYPVDQVTAVNVVNDCIAGLPVVVAGEKLPQIYDRRVNGDVLWFEWAGSNRLRAGGSVWDLTTGRAVSGRHRGASLNRLRGSRTMYWFAWLDMHPDTTVYDR